MEPSNITLIFYDKKTSFAEISGQISQFSYAGIENIESFQELDAFIKDPKNSDKSIILFMHIVAENLEGLRSPFSDDVGHKYPDLKKYWISRNSSTLKLAELDGITVYAYYKIKDNIVKNIFEASAVSDLFLGQKPVSDKNITETPIDYGIITALYNDEFEEVEKIFDWQDEHENDDNSLIRYRIGTITSANGKIKRVVTATQNKTGMVDAAILATHMIQKFKPKYLFMPGVCGGVKGIPLGSVIVASAVYTFQKGKMADFKNKSGKITTEFFNEKREPLNLNQIFDEHSRPVKMSVEKFDMENDPIELHPAVKSKIENAIKKIKDKINEPFKLENQIDIILEKMACSTMVIDKKDYFEDKIKSADRKIVAVEMEGYGIARACSLANDGKTRFLIFKGVMDNMTKKNDKAKPYAAYTSAQFLKHLLIDNIL